LLKIRGFAGSRATTVVAALRLSASCASGRFARGRFVLGASRFLAKSGPLLPIYSTMDRPTPPPSNPGQASSSSPPASGTTTLLAVVAVIIVVMVAVYAVFGRSAPRSGGGSGHEPCGSPKMPALGAGVTCAAGNGGQMAWLTTTDPRTAGLASPGNMAQLNRWVSSSNPSRVSESNRQPQCLADGSCAYDTVSVPADTECVSESTCQSKCLADGSCAFYTYDMSAVPADACSKDSDCGSGYLCSSWCASGKTCGLDGACPDTGLACTPGVCVLEHCPSQQAVCTTYKGSLPDSVSTGSIPYVTGGIPASLLLPAKSAFTSRVA